MPAAPTDSASSRKPPTVELSPEPSGPPEQGSIFFIGTATTLIRLAGFTILTDPNFLHRGERIHLGYGLHATRRTEPAISIDELPHVDFVLLSHMHEDHFDRVAAERLDRSLPIVSTKQATLVLARQGFLATHALSAWDALELRKGGGSVRVTAMPARHGPPVVSAMLPPCIGSMLDFRTPAGARFRMYVSGDTLVHDQLRAIPKHFPDVDLALLHLGGTRVLGILVTMDGAQGAEALQIIDPKVAIPIHYDDYTVFKSPLEDFRRAVDAAKLSERVHYMGRGDTYRFSGRAEAQRAIHP